jgi:hypothetical protein
VSEPTSTTGRTTQSPTATTTPDYRPISTYAPGEPGLDFGFLTQIKNSDGTISLQFDRALFYTGAEAKKHNHGEAPDDDYLIENTNPAERVFTLDPKASVMAANRLLSRTDMVGRQPLSVEEFVHNYQQALTTGSTGPSGLPVWLRHSNGVDGPVTAVAEQFLP